MHPIPETEFTDPVCGMTVSPGEAAGPLVHEGRTYYFCCADCLDEFKAEPAKYVIASAGKTLRSRSGRGREGSVAASPGPAHPTPARCIPKSPPAAPGPCPKCGMDLEPRRAAAEAERGKSGTARHDAPLLDQPRADGPGPPDRHVAHASAPSVRRRRASAGVLNAIQLVLATLVVLGCGWPFFRRGWASIVHRSLNMFTLISVGTGVAYGYSLVAALFPGVFPASFRGPSGESGRLLRSGGGHHHARPARPSSRTARARQDLRAPSRPCSALRPGPPASCATAARRRTRLWRKCARATGSACGPASECRWTASCWKARARWTRPWSPASPCPSQRPRARASSEARSTARAAS